MHLPSVVLNFIYSFIYIYSMTELEKEINNLRSGLKNVESVSTDQLYYMFFVIYQKHQSTSVSWIPDPIYVPINMFISDEYISLICLSCTGAGFPEKASTGGGR